MLKFFLRSLDYAIENDISSIVVFAQRADNLLEFQPYVKEAGKQLIAVTYPMNQVLYFEEEDGEIKEIKPELYDIEEQKKLLNNDIKLVSGTMPFESIIVPGATYNSISVVKETLNLFSEGMDLCVQSVLMATDQGAITSSERVLSLHTQLCVDMTASHSFYMFHPTKGIKIHKYIER